MSFQVIGKNVEKDAADSDSVKFRRSSLWVHGQKPFRSLHKMLLLIHLSCYLVLCGYPAKNFSMLLSTDRHLTEVFIFVMWVKECSVDH